jgi:glycosyltransferase involved in cell wall biosynthesis
MIEKSIKIDINNMIEHCTSPIITVAIPTYNRPKQLVSLFNTFLSKVIIDFDSNEVDVFISDNSDENISHMNGELCLNSSIRYYKNKENIGYSGNVINCIREARGKFIWIVSDDDYINYDNFKIFIEWLYDNQKLNFKCIMLPFINTDFFGKHHLSNTSIEWGVSKDNLINVSTLIENTGNLPFILFSSGIIRLENIDLSILDRIEKKFTDNDFVQIILFIELIGLRGTVVFYNHWLQKYKPSYQIRFNINSMNDSYFEIIDLFCNKQDNFDKKKMINRNNRRWLGWILWHNTQLVNVPGADTFKVKLVTNVLKHFSLNNSSNVLLLLLVFIPRIIMRFGYIYYLSLKDSYLNRDYSLRGLNKRIMQLREIGKDEK